MTLTINDKYSILSNIKYINDAGKLAQYVINGEITLEELKNTDEFDKIKQSQVEGALWVIADMSYSISALQTYMDNYPNGVHYAEAESKIVQLQEEETEHKDWLDVIQKGNESDYLFYMECHPNGKHFEEAKKEKEALEEERFAVDKKKYLDAIKNDPNAYSVDELIEKHVHPSDLVDVVPGEILNIWESPTIDFTLGATPDLIPKGYTEVYFWGTPGSGKTCTLGAILSRINELGIWEPEIGNGTFYMTQLANLFRGGAATLPKGTSTKTTQYLPFKLKDNKGKMHPIALVEISGEIFSCFASIINQQPFPTEEHRKTHEDLLKFLFNEDNPKFHFFVVDVTDNSVDKNGLTQQNYLQAAAMYMKDNKIFNKKTAGMCCVVTKSDLLAEDKVSRIQISRERLLKDYIAFVNQLKAIAIENRIIERNGVLPLIPFSIGSVWFQTKCLFNNETADWIISDLQRYTASVQKKRFGDFFNK